MGELKPCPFCEVVSADTREHKPDCYLRKSFGGLSDKNFDYIVAYNTRPLESSARSEGYIQALDDVMDTFMTDAYDEPKLQARYKVMIDQLKSAHGGQENGKSI
jgi:hypothetical protein